MSSVCSIFNQLTALFPRGEFEQAVREHKAERHARGFRCWTQFVAMLFCQLTQAQSLREICGGLKCSEGKLQHLGVGAAPPHSDNEQDVEKTPRNPLDIVLDTLLSLQGDTGRPVLGAHISGAHA